MAIEAAHYQETRNLLMQDPIMKGMAEDLYTGWGLGKVNPFDLNMMRILDRYKELGGTIGSHIGGPKEAVCALLVAARDKTEADCLEMMTEAEAAVGDDRDTGKVQLLRQAYSTLQRMKVQVNAWEATR